MDLSIDVVLVDVSWLVARSYYAPTHLSVELGGEVVETNDITGFLKAIKSLRACFQRAAIFLCLDDKEGDYQKKEESADYKEGRKKRKGVFDKLEECVVAACVLDGVFLVGAPKREADEIIVTLAKAIRTEGKKSVIFAKDKDMYQALGDSEYVFSKFEKGKPVKVVDEEELFLKWGVVPKACPMFQALTGDGVDGIKGIYRIRKKIAAEIAMKRRTPEELMFPANKEEFSGAAKKQLVEIVESFSKIESNFKLTNMGRMSLDEIEISVKPGGLEIVRKYKVNSFLEFLELSISKRLV